jgi:hypothetical protein
MKKLFLSLVTIGLVLSFTSLGYCANVTDNGGGNQGYILVNDGSGQGHRGVWTNPTSIPALKGDKGDKGDKGEQGIQGIQGIQGLKGDRGLQGIQGIQGIKGDTGLQGIQGLKGDKGDIGLAGKDGVNGINGIDGLKGEQGIQGIAGIDGLNGLNGTDFDPAEVIRLDNRIDVNTNDISTLDDNAVLYDINRNVFLENDLTVKGSLEVLGIVDPEALILITQNTIPSEDIGTIYYDNGNVNSFMFKDESGWRNYGKELNNHESRLNDLDNRVSDLEKTQYVAESEFRIYDGKNLTISPFVRQNFSRNKVDTVGIRFTFKLGTSYEEREIAKTNARLDRTEQRLGSLEERLGQPAYIEETKVVNTKGKVISQSFHIQALPEGLIVNKKF